MPRLLPAFARKVLPTTAVAILLVSAPVQLAAVGKEAPSAGPVSVLAWFSALWSSLAPWFTSEETGTDLGHVVDPHGGSQSDTDNGHLLDPHGG